MCCDRHLEIPGVSTPEIIQHSTRFRYTLSQNCPASNTILCNRCSTNSHNQPPTNTPIDLNTSNSFIVSFAAMASVHLISPFFCRPYLVTRESDQVLSYGIASENVIKPCIKPDNPLVEKICKLLRKLCIDVHKTSRLLTAKS